jgi:hypothetical protein
MWDIETGNRIPAPNTGSSKVLAVALGVLDEREVLVTASLGGAVVIWDAATSNRLAGIKLDAAVSGVWVARKTDVVGALTVDSELQLFDFVARRSPAVD